tara:strand:+ start:878 stop:1423 length:546 start_codon:yes stop_codon:yes gene_type:complete
MRNRKEPLLFLNNFRFLTFVLCFVACFGDLAKGHTKKTQNRALIKQMVIQEADKIGISKSLALAVAHAESNFNPLAESHKGARGVMQIMPATSQGEYLIHPDRLWDPRINIIIGLHYLRRLLIRYRGRPDLALSFYNGGSAVDRYGRGRPRVISYTRAYVMKVTRLRFKYERRLRSGKLRL